MTFKLLRSVGCAGALLLAAVGCNVETSSEADGEIESTTQALCDTNYYVGICQRQCINGCTDGNVIAACMSVCIGGYCAQQQFRPHERCGSSAWWPEPARTPLASQPNCESDAWGSCQTKCELCNAPGSTGLGVCLRNCTETWCTVSDLSRCHERNRNRCHEDCFLRTPVGESIYPCLVPCLGEGC